ncbi:hypothetical protein SLEP1_g7192 [Rubroshorea leprosula]|uniref:Uncharacterized protein n=1 Tax=Rubroshorea leprosula TaxID=152421 RepID=A0AAV5I3E9_9ROSI|nr:hypothetical protein SLEP1_g7192 [Rubroshorea leprosula]
MVSIAATGGDVDGYVSVSEVQLGFFCAYDLRGPDRCRFCLRRPIFGFLGGEGEIS